MPRLPSLENRQRHKIGEQEADLARLKAEIASLRRDHERLLAENGRFADAVGELQSQLHSVSMCALCALCALWMCVLHVCLVDVCFACEFWVCAGEGGAELLTVFLQHK